MEKSSTWNKIYPLVLISLSGLLVHLEEFKSTFHQADVSDLPFSIYVVTGDLNHVWCVAAVLASDPRLSGGPRWQRVKVKGNGGRGWAWVASDGWKVCLSGSAEPRQSQTSIWGETVLCVNPFRAPRPTLSVPTHLRALEEETEAADVWRAEGWWFPH